MLDTTQPKSIVILRSAHKRRCSKTWILDQATGEWVKDGTMVARDNLWRVDCKPFETLDEFAAILSAVERDPYAGVIRGALPAGTEIPAEGLRRSLASSGSGGLWVPCPRQWLAFDLDGAKQGIQIPRGMTDAELPGYLRAALPAPWNQAGCWWQFTASHRMPDKQYTKMRIWYPLSHPINDAGAENIIKNTLVLGCQPDVCTSRTVQFHFTAAPQFEGGLDPFPTRSGVLPGPIADISGMQESERIAVPRAGTGILIENPTDAEVHDDEVAGVRARIMAAEVGEGDRHRWMMGAAGELYMHRVSITESEQILAAVLRKNGREPNSPTEIRDVIKAAMKKVNAGRWESRGRVPRSVLLKELPGDGYVLPEHRAPPGDGVDDLKAEMVSDGMANQAFGKAERINAQIIMDQDKVEHPWIWSHEQWYRWEGDRYVPFANLEAVKAHIRERVCLTNKIGNATAEAFTGMIREKWRRNELTAPCMVPSGERPAPYLHFTNGILRVDEWLLDPGELPKPPTPDRFVTARPVVPYDPAAKCPQWLRFLDSIWGDDPEQITELQKMFGYLLTGMTHMQKSFWLIGASNGGKGTICEVLQALVGHDNACAMRWSDFSQEFGAQRLPGKTLCTVDEANETNVARIPMQAIDFIKTVVGEGPTQVNRKGLMHWSGVLPVRFVFTANEFPSVMDGSGAFGRRVQLFVFRKSFTAKPDTDLKPRLLGELPGIAQWALAGLRRLLLDDRKFLETSAAAERWKLLNRRMARTAHAYATFLQPAQGGELDVRDIRTVLVAHHQAEGWEKADHPVPRLAEQIVTQFGTLGHVVETVETSDGKTRLRGLTWTKAGADATKALGLDLNFLD